MVILSSGYEKQHSDCVFNLFLYRTEEEKKDWIQVSTYYMSCHSSVSTELSACFLDLRFLLLTIFISMAHSTSPICVSQAIQATIQRHEQSVETFRMLTCSVREDDCTPPNSPVRCHLLICFSTYDISLCLFHFFCLRVYDAHLI